MQQQEAPTLVAKLKDAGVTTVLLYAPYTTTGYLFEVADNLDYHPEWVFPGYGVSDIEVTARINNAAYPDQMEHVFGLGTLPPYVDGLEDPQVGWFTWYWGPGTGVYQAFAVAPLYTLYAGVSLAGPKLTPALFQRGLFAMPANGGAASDQVVSYMFGYGRTSGLPYDEYTTVGLDYAVMWWSPTDTGKGKLILDEGIGRYRYIDDAKRYYAGQWKKGEPELFDKGNSIAQFESLPSSDVVPTYPCKGCPSTVELSSAHERRLHLTRPDGSAGEVGLRAHRESIRDDHGTRRPRRGDVEDRWRGLRAGRRARRRPTSRHPRRSGALVGDRRRTAGVGLGHRARAGALQPQGSRRQRRAVGGERDHHLARTDRLDRDAVTRDGHAEARARRRGALDLLEELEVGTAGRSRAGEGDHRAQEDRERNRTADRRSQHRRAPRRVVRRA